MTHNPLDTPSPSEPSTPVPVPTQDADTAPMRVPVANLFARADEQDPPTGSYTDVDELSAMMDWCRNGAPDEVDADIATEVTPPPDDATYIELAPRGSSAAIESAPRSRLARGSVMEVREQRSAVAHTPASHSRATHVAIGLAGLSSMTAALALTLVVGLVAKVALAADALTVGLVAGTTAIGAMLGFLMIALMYPQRPLLRGAAIVAAPLAAQLLDHRGVVLLALASLSGLAAIIAYGLIGELERRPDWPAITWRRRR